MDQFLDPETDANCQFLDPETEKKYQFLYKNLLDTETDVMEQFLGDQKLTHYVIFWFLGYFPSSCISGLLGLFLVLYLCLY